MITLTANDSRLKRVAGSDWVLVDECDEVFERHYRELKVHWSKVASKTICFSGTAPKQADEPLTCRLMHTFTDRVYDSQLYVEQLPSTIDKSLPWIEHQLQSRSPKKVYVVYCSDSQLSSLKKIVEGQKYTINCNSNDILKALDK